MAKNASITLNSAVTRSAGGRARLYAPNYQRRKSAWFAGRNCRFRTGSESPWVANGASHAHRPARTRPEECIRSQECINHAEFSSYA